MLFWNFFIFIKKSVCQNKKKVIKTPVKLVMQGTYFTSQPKEGKGIIVIRFYVMYIVIKNDKDPTHTQTQNCT